MAGSQSGSGEDQATQILPGQDAVIVTRLADPPDAEPQPPTQVVPQHPPTEVAAPSPPAASRGPDRADSSADRGCVLSRPGGAGRSGS